MVEQNQILKFNDHDVRMIMRGEEPWWVASSVCDILGIKNTAQAVSRLDEDERGITNTYTPSGTQETLIVNEPGLYSLILRSRKPEAKAFKRWVTHEVLPSLRKNGLYIVPGAGESVLQAQAMELVRQLGRMDARLEALEGRYDQAVVEAESLPQPLGVLPGLTNANYIRQRAKVLRTLTGMTEGAMWSWVYNQIELRYGLRITHQKKRRNYKGSNLKFAIEHGHADKIDAVLYDLTERAMEMRRGRLTA